MASFSGLTDGAGCPLGYFVLFHAASHPSWLYWVLYMAFSGPDFKREEAARPLEGRALELTQQQFCRIRLVQTIDRASPDSPPLDGSSKILWL